MKNKKRNKNKYQCNIRRLDIIRKKIESHLYDDLNENELLFISNEIETNRISLEEVQRWMNQR